MSVEQITVEFVFDEELIDDDYVHHTLAGISVVDHEGWHDSVAEGWAQSDFYWVGVTNALLDVISTGTPVDREDIRW